MAEPVEEAEYYELRLHFEKFMVRSMVTEDLLQHSAIPSSQIVEGMVGRELIFELTRFMAFRDSRSFSHPTTWWDAFKERWFPTWALARWPAEYSHHVAREYFVDVPKPEGLSLTIPVIVNLPPHVR